MCVGGRNVLVGALVSAAALVGLQGAAWGRPGLRTIGTPVPRPLARGQAQLRGARRAHAQLSLSFGLHGRQRAEEQALIAADSTLSSPRYGHYLTPAEYMASFAPTDAQVEAWLRRRGLRVTGVSKDHLFVYAQGSTASVDRALGVAINDYRAGDRRFFASDRAPRVPADLPITSVKGLTDYETSTPDTTCFNYGGKRYGCGITGVDIREIYNIKGEAAGQTIAFTLQQGEPMDQSTLETYAKSEPNGDLPTLKIGKGYGEIEFVKASAYSASAAFQREMALDIETAYLIAPRAHLVFCIGDEAVNKAAQSNAKVISDSWETEEGTCPLNVEEESVYEMAALEGKTFVFSTGDNGAAHGCGTPSSSAYVLAVGGTVLELVGDQEFCEGFYRERGLVRFPWCPDEPEQRGITAINKIQKETAFNNGGNCNKDVSRPPWQTNIGDVYVYPTGVCTGRVTPDVAAVSCFEGEPKLKHLGECPIRYSEAGSEKMTFSGGTSLAAPIWASAIAVWNQDNAREGRPEAGWVTPLIYELGNDSTTYPRDFHDITNGSNGFVARPGWDEATGWGSANFTALRTNEASLKYIGDTQAMLLGKPIGLGAQLTDKGTPTPLPGRKIHFELGSSRCEAMTGPSGLAFCAVPNRLGAGMYSVKASFAGDAAYDEASTSASFTIINPPRFGIELLQKIGSSTPTRGPLPGIVGQTVQYEIIVTNVGSVPLYSKLTDADCEGISPRGDVRFEPHARQTYTCSHTLTSAGLYTNQASISGGVGIVVSNTVQTDVPS